MAGYRPGSRSMLAATLCPHCGTDTGIVREREPSLGSLSLDEFETLVRSEWRRRLGKNAYRRPHSRALIRALVVFALKPESPIRSAVVEELLWKEIAAFEAGGLNRWLIQAELLRLSQAIWEVLSLADLELDHSQTLMERISRKLLRTPSWPA